MGRASRSLKIAVVVGSFPELSTTFILDQITGLIDRGHDVHVFGRTPERVEPLHAAFTSYRLAERTHHWGGSAAARRAALADIGRLLLARPARHGAALARSLNPLTRGALSDRYVGRVACMLEHGPFDVVLAQFGVNGRLAEHLRSFGAFDAPIATTWLGYDLTRVVRDHGANHYQALFRNTELMLPLSENFAERLAALGCPREKLRLHHLGVDPTQFAFVHRMLAPNAAVRVVTVCRLVEKKGLDFALAALARVAATGAHFEYHVVGDGPKRAELEAQCDALGLRSRTSFHGARSREEVRGLLASGHLFLAPSVVAKDGDEEGTPTAILEAMAVGLPVVSTLHSGIPEMIRDGVSGFLVPERDVEQLAERLQLAISEPARWPALAREGRATVERSFDIARLNDQLSDVLIELADRYAEARVLRPAS